MPDTEWIRFGFEVAGAKQLERRFKTLLDGTKDASPAMWQIESDFRNMEAETFASGGAYDGNTLHGLHLPSAMKHENSIGILECPFCSSLVR